MNHSPPLNAIYSHRRRLIVLLAVAVLVVVLFSGYEFSTSYREAIYDAESNTRNYAAIFETRLDATLRRADGVLQKLAREIPVAILNPQAVPIYAPVVDASLDSSLINFKELAGLRIADANGDIVYTSDSANTQRVSTAERSYFRRLRDNPQADLVFSETITSLINGRQIVVIARALRDQQGVFRGIVFASIELAHFQSLFSSLALGAGGVIVIRRSDDFSAAVRWPALEREVNRPLPPGNPVREAMLAGRREGTLEFAASSDGVVRIYSYRSLDRYPFFVLVALARDDVLAGWRARALALGVSGLLLLSLLAWLLLRLWHMEAREGAAMAALQESEERLRLAISSSGQGLYDRNVQTGAAVVNAEYALMLGHDPAQFHETNAAWIERLHPDDRERVAATYRDYLGGKLPEYRVEFRQRCADGQYKWIFSVGKLVERDSQGQPLRMVGTHFDITARKRAEQAILELNAELEQRVGQRTAKLEQANKELETFTYSVSHDLKAPLRGIDGYSRLLLEEHSAELGENGRRFLQNVRRAAQQMNQLINDLLTYSRLEHRDMQAVEVDLRALAQALLEERADEIGARGVAVSVTACCPSVIADREGLSMAFRNLLDNALKFTRDTPNPAIEIGGRDAGSACILWVRDNGVGFDMKFHDRVFTIFQRLHRAEDYPGTGVGLAIVRKAMQRMGGRVWGESEPGTGATFHLEIPK